MEKFYKNLEKLDLHTNLQKERIQKLKNAINSITIPDVSSKNKELNEVISNIKNNFAFAINSWKEEINKLVAEHEFSEYLKNKFIVIVYGKVKAGKSTLGNFVANNDITKKLNKKAKFFVYEGNNKKNIKKLEEFKTDNLECTNVIQGFELDSLAWIDTPGLLSITKQNEVLAKKYINAADFIIFPTSSDAPMQKSEINELKELQKFNKKFHIVITKSDSVKEGEVGGKIINVLRNKSEEIRKMQEDDVRERLEKEGIKVENIFSISVKMAQNGDLEGSNILKFFEFMDKEVVNKAAILKQNTQNKRIDGFIKNDIYPKIQMLENSLDNLKIQQNKIHKKIKQKINSAKSDAIFIVNGLIDINEINRDNIKDKFLKIQSDAYSMLEKKLKEDVVDIFSGFDKEFTDFIEMVSVDEFEIKDKYKKVKVVITTKKRGAQTFGATLGGLIGGMLGGPVGSFLGAAAGAYLAGEIVGVDEYIEKIKIGDSKIEEIQKFKKKLQKSLENSINQFYENLDKSLVKEIGVIINSLQKEISLIKERVNV